MMLIHLKKLDKVYLLDCYHLQELDFEVGGNLDKDGSGDITQKDILIARGVS